MKKKDQRSKKTEASDLNAAAASKTDTKTSSSKPAALAAAEKKAESAPVSDVKPAQSTSAPAAMPQVAKPAAVVASNAAADSVQKVPKTPPAVPASQASASVSENPTDSTFSRDSIARSLNEMVSVPVTSRTAEDLELVEKQRSAFEFAISMYLAATEFYDGGSLWCRQCDCIFSDITALCRHIHSDKHQLVSFTLLTMYELIAGIIRIL